MPSIRVLRTREAVRVQEWRLLEAEAQNQSLTSDVLPLQNAICSHCRRRPEISCLDHEVLRKVQSTMMMARKGCSVLGAAMLRPSYNETSTSFPFEPDNFLLAVCSVVDRRFRAHCGHAVPRLGRRGPAKKSKTPPALYLLLLACFTRLLYIAHETINVSSHGVYILKSFVLNATHSFLYQYPCR